VSEDRSLESRERHAGVEPKLLDQPPTRRSVGSEGIALSARPVEGDHQLLNQSLPMRMLRHQTLELRDELEVATRRELSLDSLFNHF
jgi:hypothetical protein